MQLRAGVAQHVNRIYFLSESNITLLLSSSSIPTSSTPPGIEKSVAAFKESLSVSDEKIREIELNTREQRKSTLPFQARRYRITSTLFGQVLQRKELTPPDKLVQSCNRSNFQPLPHSGVYNQRITCDGTISGYAWTSCCPSRTFLSASLILF